MTRQEEVQTKLERVGRFLEQHSLSAMVLSTQANFAWVTGGGDNHVAAATDNGVAHLVITPSEQHVVTTNIEAGRIQDEELRDLIGFTMHATPWQEDQTAQIIADLAGPSPGSDTGNFDSKNVAGEFARLRWELLEPEVQRFRWVGEQTGRILGEVARELEPGWTEHQIAAALGERFLAQGILPAVLLVAADQRIRNYRHPIPTETKLERCVMMAVGARRWGLGVSATRLVHFGPLSEELERKHRAVCEIDATFISGSRPGGKVADIFAAAVARYEQTGYAQEWQLHHQGGATGYAPRDYKGSHASTEVVLNNQAFAWNPSITGTKSEDTIIAAPEATTVISATPDWPMLSVRVEGATMERPDILVR